VVKEKVAKEFRTKPPTEEERAALRLKKEQEKLAKAQAKETENNLTPAEIQSRSAKAAAVIPAQAGASGSQTAVSDRMRRARLIGSSCRPICPS
jgi:uncharacterized protein (DUF1778 family)